MVDRVFCCDLMYSDVDSRPPPIIYHGPQNQTLPVNSVATLSCSASGEPAPVISWYRNQRIIPSRDHRFTILQSGALQITGIRRPTWLSPSAHDVGLSVVYSQSLNVNCIYSASNKLT